MSDEDNMTFNIKGLEQIIKALKVKPPMIRLGILGDKDARVDGKRTNSKIGAAHEFGIEGQKQRSFLRQPITDYLDKKLESAGMLDEDVIKEVIKTGEVLPWVKKVAVIAKAIVDEAFASGGYGKWDSWEGNYTSRTGLILVDTTQLRDSITWDLK